jgi:hypothetical protein
MPSKGSTQVEGVDSGVLITDAGERWRQYRLPLAFFLYLRDSLFNR